MENISSADINPTDEKDFRCAPTKKFKDGSCLSLNGLIALTKAYNDAFPNKIIKLYPMMETLNTSKYKRYLVKMMKQRLDKVCDNQRCWLTQDFVKKINGKIKDDILRHTWRRKGPQGKFEWLNTIHLNNVMEQYEKKYPDFKFLGAVPADFDEFDQFGIKNLNFDKLLKSGKSKIGVIFNLDEHDKGGSHWVSLVADIKAGQIYFSDSYGIEPEPRFRKFMRRVARYARDKLNIPQKKLDVRHNKTEHQRGNSECGVYSINFILRFLKGESFDEITSKRISDSEVHKCRKVYFT